MKTVLVTGGSGFIGANFLNLLVPRHPDVTFVNLDKLSYAANPLSTAVLKGEPNYKFERVDICDQSAVSRVFEEYNPNWVIHFAAESHVDKSIDGPREFINTNVVGTFNLLEACRENWSSFENRLFLNVSTDEVYGSLGADGLFDESSRYDPSSPYSASKASGDHFVRAYHRTYGLPVKITHSSNNYGPYQFPEKLIPLTIMNALGGTPLPVYGKGENVRDWLFVQDNCEAIWAVAKSGQPGESYNIGAGQEKTNLEVVHAVCDAVAEATGKNSDQVRNLVEFVSDRPGHDFRYATDTTKIKNELNWAPTQSFEAGIKQTALWYMKNHDWVKTCFAGQQETR